MGQVFSVCLGDLCPSSTPAPLVTTASVRNAAEITPRCCFGAGCYWGTEKYFKYDFAKKTHVRGSIENGAVGFMGPKSAKKNPTYEEVCTGKSGHVEVYDFEFTGGVVYYEAVVRFFFQFHDPTTLDKQGNDGGTQYASVIYCYDERQVKVATAVKNELQALIDTNQLCCFKNSTVVTDIRLVEADFFPALEPHQDYLEKNPRGYCNHRIRFTDWAKSSPIKSN